LDKKNCLRHCALSERVLTVKIAGRYTAIYNKPTVSLSWFITPYRESVTHRNMNSQFTNQLQIKPQSHRKFAKWHVLYRLRKNM